MQHRRDVQNRDDESQATEAKQAEETNFPRRAVMITASPSRAMEFSSSSGP
jgi:hypothetical protein